MQKILFVSHCILNTAAKVVRYGDTGKKEEESRLEFVVKTVEQEFSWFSCLVRNLPFMDQVGGDIQRSSLTIRFSGSIAEKFWSLFSLR